MTKEIKIRVVQDKLIYEGCDITFRINHNVRITENEVKYQTFAEYFSDEFGCFVPVDLRPKMEGDDFKQVILDKLNQRIKEYERFEFSEDEIKLIRWISKYELLMNMAEEFSTLEVYCADGFEERILMYGLSELQNKLNISTIEMYDRDTLERAIRVYVSKKMSDVTNFSYVDFAPHSKGKLFLYAFNDRKYLRIRSTDNFEYTLKHEEYNDCYWFEKDEKYLAYERQFVLIKPTKKDKKCKNKVYKERKKLIRNIYRRYGKNVIVNIICDYFDGMVLEVVLKI